MKCTIPEISWHNREPVLSVDIHPISKETYRLATSGGDSHVLIWHMNLNKNGSIKQELVSDLTRHQRAVNVVRWSPSGKYLASADDDANIIVWQQKTDNIPLLEGDTGDKEVWIVYKILRGHKEDVYDLCWSVDGLKLFTGSIDNTAILWDLTKGKMDHILTDHKGFVQGVAWDPKDQILATISTDRICRIFTTNGKHVKARIYKGQLTVPSDHCLYKKDVKYFHDDTFKSFFRRLDFSPDGSLLVVPSGHIETDDCKKTLNATLVFTLDDLKQPTAILPLKRQSSTSVRFCPILFELHQEGPNPIVNLPYRMIFAVSTDHDVILYDTQQNVPFARFQDIHYTRLTDLTWSRDGRLLIASSTDGFCALITFDEQELGITYVKEESETEENPMDISGCEELDKEEKEVSDVKKEAEKKKRPSFIEQWAIKTPKRIKLDGENKKTAKKETNEVIEITDDEDDVKELPNDIKEEINELLPRRGLEKQKKDKEEPSKEKKEHINKLTPRRAVAKVQNTINEEKSTVKMALKDEDDIEELPSEIREEINRLIPRKATITMKDHKMNDDKSVAKPIAVRRKPRQEEGVKIIEVRREARVVGNDLKENKPVNNAVLEEKSDNFGVKERNEEKILECEKVKHEEDSVKRGNKVKKVEKKEETKIKVPSSVKKGTPPRNSPLLKFLTKSSEKSKKNTKKDTPSCVDLTLGEEEARDAWKCDKDLKEDENVPASEQPMEEDCTEDFTLQLENTQESEMGKSKTDEAKEGDKEAKLEASIQISDDSSDADKMENSKSNVEKKVPRRVQLITLASPKGKKKQKP